MRLLFLAGIGNSGAGHWQREWFLESDNASWVEHTDWDNPVMEEWLADLEAALDNIDGPVTVIAHSMGCLLFTEWLRRCEHRKVAAALLVAFPDVFSPVFPPQAHNFSNLKTKQACCPAIVITSDNDPYGSAEHAAKQAEALQATIYNIGPVGHINANSGLGNWPEGKAYLTTLIDSVS
ncbi:hypothetical protein DI392_01805 [Vibrio albus]|jgi:hypothetical protein|uniref:Alpha/beta hydrolase n=1 Tax=Vibrio albus TaxID=2200953 RepID=A0A2U3BE39_9VIBR|nr:alpha/beta hydrolase [Vibrio albus]PWI35037.1 hypothetical protein DI392_01805 [Vibrio albus]